MRKEQANNNLRSKPTTPWVTGASAAAKFHEVLFPCVHGEARGELIKLRAYLVPELKSTIKVTSSGIDEADARRVIGISRYDEHSALSAAGVIAKLSKSTFSGPSYELALAIADKLARFHPVLGSTPIIATGRLSDDGLGTVAQIGQFEAKIKVVLRHALPDSLFVFPQENLSNSSPQEQVLLKDLLSHGIKWQAISHIEKLQGIVWRYEECLPQLKKPPPSTLPKRSPSFTLNRGGLANGRWIAPTALVLALAALGISSQYFTTFTWHPEGVPTTNIPAKLPLVKNTRLADVETATPPLTELSSQNPLPSEPQRLESSLIDTTPY